MTSATRTTTDPIEAVAISTICVGWAILSSTQSVVAGFKSAAFTDGAFIGLIVLELVCASIALLTLYFRKYAVSTLCPVPSTVGLGVGLALYLATWIACWTLTAPFAASRPEQPIDSLVSTASISLPTLVAASLVNGTYEEVFLLGFLLRGLRGYGFSIAIGVSLLVRVLYHLYQGPLGALSVLGFGLVLSLYYVRTGLLFPAVFAHMLADIVPFIWR